MTAGLIVSFNKHIKALNEKGVTSPQEAIDLKS
jgi:hypothetical protein